MTPKYRPDIDGLRAVAVLAIVFFHLGIDAFGGGYVGVDIFFVISGFLITTIIAREIRDGSFTIARFYERRVRRILPALVVVLIATLGAGLVILPPEQLDELAQSALATSVFSSNFFFFAGAGYFDGPSEAKPLLHTWSLAVEEQYYILFPLLMLLIARRAGGRFTLPVGCLALASFAACALYTSSDETAAFFLIPFRAWELLIGSLLALGAVPAVHSRRFRTALAAAGLAMVLASVFSFTPLTTFPGVAAALPTLGTAAIIHAGTHGDNAIGRALSVRPMVFVGLVSYSLYLWHWPVIVYAKLYLINEMTDGENALAFVIAMLLAVLSWRFVEAPFRDRRRFGPRSRLFAGAAMVTAVVMAGAVAIVHSDGLPDRDLSGEMRAIAAVDPGWQHWKYCEELGEERNDDPELCGIGAEERSPTFLLWGDSHALAMASGINLKAMEHGKGGLIAVRTACPPLLGIDRAGRDSCRVFNDAILRRLEREPGIDTVILAARWTMAAPGTRYKEEPGSDVILEDRESGEGGNAELMERGLARTLDALQALGRRVVLVGQVPEVGFDVPSANYSARLTGRDVSDMIAPRVDEYRERVAVSSDILARARAGRAVEFLDPAPSLCDAARCRVVEEGMPLYRDDNHLSLRGNVVMAPLFDALFVPGGAEHDAQPRE